MYKTTLKIDGMACSMCQAHVNDALRSAVAAKKVKSSFKTGIAELVSEEAPDEAKLRGAIEATGYHVLSCTTEPYVRRRLFGS